MILCRSYTTSSHPKAVEAGADAPEPSPGTAVVPPAFFRTEWNVPETERRNIWEAGGGVLVEGRGVKFSERTSSRDA